MQMKRYLSLLLSLVMVASILPTYSINAFALDCRHDRTCISVTLPAGCTAQGYTVNASADGKMGFCTQCGKFVSKRINTYRAYNTILEYRTNSGDVTVLEPTGHIFDGELTEDANCTYYAQRRCSVGNPTYSSVRNPETLKFEFVVNDGTCAEIGYSTASEDAPNGEHMYLPSDSVEPTCTEAGYDLAVCYYCGDADETPIPALGHDYSDLVQGISPTCTDDGYDVYACSRCGNEQMTEYPALGHDFTVLVSETKPTCTTGGSVTNKCSRCDETETKELEALGHNFGKWTVAVPATCTAGGKEQRVCETCAEVDSREIEALGHNYVVTAGVEPTCTTGGSKQYTCNGCGDTYTENLDALGHEYASDWTLVKAPTCTEKGIEAKGCIHLGCSEQETREVAELGHKFGAKETVAPTCAEQGYTVYACSRCPEAYNDNLTAALGHDWEEVTIIEPGCTEPGKKGERCKRCLEYNTEAETEIPAAHKYVFNTEKSTAASCGVAGAEVYTCSVCGDEYSVEIPALGHNYVKDEAMSTEPTCTENGCVAFRCTICDDVQLDIIEATGHNLVPMSFPYRAPTCTEGGYMYEACRNCKRILYTTLPALGHDYEVVQHKEPTCTENGHDTYVCSHCSDGYEKELPALGHDYVLNEETAVEPSCTTAEYKEYNCSRCGDCCIITNPARGHLWYLDAEDYIRSTCTEAGSQLWRCLYCEEELLESLPARGHNFGELETESEPTCTTPGYSVSHCLREGCTEVLRIEKPAYGHTEGEVTYENLVNCYVDEISGKVTPFSCLTGYSYDKVYECRRCFDEVRETVEVEPHDHELEIVGTSDSTCAELVTYKCKICGEQLSETVSGIGNHELERGQWLSFPVLDFETYTFTYVQYYKQDPTCVDDGYEVYHCKKCFANFEIPIPATGEHKYELVSSTVSCLNDGVNTYKCKYCDSTYTEEVDAENAEHSFRLSEADSTAPTCTENGEEVWICENCRTRKVVPIASTGHKFIVVAQQEPSCVDGYGTYRCDICHYEYTDVIPATKPHTLERGYLVAITTNGQTAYSTSSAYDKEPTCVNGGWEMWHCKECGENIQIDVPATDNHDFQFESTTATCTEGGVDTYMCQYCGKIETYEVGPSSDHHSYAIVPEESWEATCEQVGRVTYQCSVCGDKYFENIEKKTDHDWKFYSKPATCTDGVSYSYCKNCGKRKDEVVIPAVSEHNLVEVTEESLPTCTAQGYKKGYCTTCGQLCEVYIPALGHDYGDYTVTNAATCTSAGEKQRTCQRADCGYVEKTTVPALGHDFVTYYHVPATMDADGYEVQRCTRCVVTKTANPVAKIKSITPKVSQYEYNGKEKKPAVTIKDAKGKEIKSGYYLDYKNNKKIGIATVTVHFIPNSDGSGYTGSYKRTFKIYPAAPVLTKLEKTKKGTEIKVTWSKYAYSGSIDGYRVEYSTSKDFKNSKYKTVKKPKSNTYTLTGLKKNTTYYVRVKAYKTVSGTNYLNASKSKSLKISK